MLPPLAPITFGCLNSPLQTKEVSSKKRRKAAEGGEKRRKVAKSGKKRQKASSRSEREGHLRCSSAPRPSSAGGSRGDTIHSGLASSRTCSRNSGALVEFSMHASRNVLSCTPPCPQGKVKVRAQVRWYTHEHTRLLVSSGSWDGRKRGLGYRFLYRGGVREVHCGVTPTVPRGRRRRACLSHTCVAWNAHNCVVY